MPWKYLRIIQRLSRDKSAANPKKEYEEGSGFIFRCP